MKTRDQVIAEQKRLHPRIAPEEPKEVLTIITPGRRALGETWSKVTVGALGDDITIDRQDAPAPADGKAIMAVAGADAEYSRYIVEAQMEKAKERAVAPTALTAKERHDAINAAWHAYMEDKLRWLKGQTTIGAAGMVQRERVPQNPTTRPGVRRHG